MVPEDKLAFATLLTGISELYGKDMSKSLMQIYFDMLSVHDIAAVRAAFQSHVRDPERGQYFPKPADIIDKINGTSREGAMAAWPEVLRLATNSRSARSEDPVTEQVVRDMGGWRRFGMSDAKELGWMQREFLERYASFTRHEGNQALAAPADNSRRIGKLVSISAFGDRKETP